MPRKAADNMNFDTILKSIIERTEIATAKDFDQIMKRLDKLENKLSSSKSAPGKRVRNTGERSRIAGPVLDVIQKSKKGADVETVQAKTGFDKGKIRNAFFLLGKAGKIKRKSRGVYEAV
jgi:hypothetical protein